MLRMVSWLCVCVLLISIFFGSTYSLNAHAERWTLRRSSSESRQRIRRHLQYKIERAPFSKFLWTRWIQAYASSVERMLLLEQYKKRVVRHPKKIQIVFLYARLLGHLGYTRSAIHVVEHVPTSKQTYASYAFLASLYSQIGHSKRLYSTYVRAEQLYSTSFQFFDWLRYLRVTSQLKHKAQTLRIVRRMQLFPEFSREFFWVVRMLLHVRLYTQAKLIFKHSIRHLKGETKVRAWIRAARIWMHAKRWNEALICIRRARALPRIKHWFKKELQLLEISIFRFQRKLPLYVRRMQRSQSSEKSEYRLLLLAQLNKEIGRIQLARTLLLKALRLFPRSERVRKRMIQNSLALGYDEEAMKHMEWMVFRNVAPISIRKRWIQALIQQAHLPILQRWRPVQAQHPVCRTFQPQKRIGHASNQGFSLRQIVPAPPAHMALRAGCSKRSWELYRRYRKAMWKRYFQDPRFTRPVARIHRWVRMWLQQKNIQLNFAMWLEAHMEHAGLFECARSIRMRWSVHRGFSSRTWRAFVFSVRYASEGYLLLKRLQLILDTSSSYTQRSVWIQTLLSEKKRIQHGRSDRVKKQLHQIHTMCLSWYTRLYRNNRLRMSKAQDLYLWMLLSVCAKRSIQPSMFRAATHALDVVQWRELWKKLFSMRMLALVQRILRNQYGLSKRVYRTSISALFDVIWEPALRKMNVQSVLRWVPASLFVSKVQKICSHSRVFCTYLTPSIDSWIRSKRGSWSEKLAVIQSRLRYPLSPIYSKRWMDVGKRMYAQAHSGSWMLWLSLPFRFWRSKHHLLLHLKGMHKAMRLRVLSRTNVRKWLPWLRKHLRFLNKERTRTDRPNVYRIGWMWVQQITHAAHYDPVLHRSVLRLLLDCVYPFESKWIHTQLRSRIYTSHVELEDLELLRLAKHLTPKTKKHWFLSAVHMQSRLPVLYGMMYFARRIIASQALQDVLQISVMKRIIHLQPRSTFILRRLIRLLDKQGGAFVESDRLALQLLRLVHPKIQVRQINKRIRLRPGGMHWKRRWILVGLVRYGWRAFHLLLLQEWKKASLHQKSIWLKSLSKLLPASRGTAVWMLSQAQRIGLNQTALKWGRWLSGLSDVDPESLRLWALTLDSMGRFKQSSRVWERLFQKVDVDDKMHHLNRMAHRVERNGQYDLALLLRYRAWKASELSSKQLLTYAFKTSPKEPRNALSAWWASLEDASICLQKAPSSRSFVHFTASRLWAEGVPYYGPFVFFAPCRIQPIHSSRPSIRYLATFLRTQSRLRVALSAHFSAHEPHALFLAKQRLQYVKTQLLAQGVAKRQIHVQLHSYPVSCAKLSKRLQAVCWAYQSHVSVVPMDMDAKTLKLVHTSNSFLRVWGRDSDRDGQPDRIDACPFSSQKAEHRIRSALPFISTSQQKRPKHRLSCQAPSFKWKRHVSQAYQLRMRRSVWLRRNQRLSLRGQQWLERWGMWMRVAPYLGELHIEMFTSDLGWTCTRRRHTKKTSKQSTCQQFMRDVKRAFTRYGGHMERLHWSMRPIATLNTSNFSRTRRFRRPWVRLRWTVRARP